MKPCRSAVDVRLDGLLRMSKSAHHRIEDVRDELREGDNVMVKVIINDPTVKIRLSRTVLLPTGYPVLEG